MAKPVKVALAGISGYGHSYLEALLTNRHGMSFEFVACVDPSPQRCKSIDVIRVRGIPVYPTMLGLYGAHPDLDLVMLSTPIHLHASQIGEAVRAGASVLCEKPLAGSVADAQRVLRADSLARQQNRFVAIGYQWSFSRAVLELKADVLAGTFGRALRMRTRVDFPRDVAYFTRNGWAGRLRAPSGEEVNDSPVNNATAHYLHNMLFLLGEQMNTAAIPVAVQAELYRANEIENYDTAMLRCEMAGGTELLFYTTHSVSDRCGPHFTYEFEAATVTYDARDGEIRAAFTDGTQRSYGSPEKDRDRKIWQSIDAVRSGVSLPCTPRTAYPHALCAAAAQQSAEITPFPAAMRRSVAVESGAMIVVDGLADCLSNCFAEGILPSEAGRYEWARAGRRVLIDVGSSRLTEAVVAST